MLKRLLPLYIGIFLQGLIFWYAIEKLFMANIGFDAEAIAISVAAYSAMALLTDIPSGILADRWSRKGVLMLSSLVLATSSFIGAISSSVPIYLISSAIWGIYVSLKSDTMESITYDVLLEERGNANSYEREVGKLYTVSSAALILGSIAGGIIGQYAGLRETYWLSIPIILLSIIFLWRFKEPKLYKINQNKSLLQHIKLTFESVFTNKNLIWILISLISSSVVWTMIMEMGQVWLIALLVPVILYGPIHALMTSTFGVGGLLSDKIKSKSNIFIGMFISLIALFCLIFIHNMWVAITATFAILLINYSVNIVITHKLHDNLPSQVRAGSASSISAVQRLIVIPISILFGAIASQYSIFTAGWLLVVILLIAIVSLAISKTSSKLKVANE